MKRAPAPRAPARLGLLLRESPGRVPPAASAGCLRHPSVLTRRAHEGGERGHGRQEPCWKAELCLAHARGHQLPDAPRASAAEKHCGEAEIARGLEEETVTKHCERPQRDFVGERCLVHMPAGLYAENNTRVVSCAPLALLCSLSFDGLRGRPMCPARRRGAEPPGCCARACIA